MSYGYLAQVLERWMATAQRQPIGHGSAALDRT